MFLTTKLRLLLSHTCTKLGSKAWEFATPLLLLRFSPDGGLIAPAIFGLTVYSLQFVVGPAVGQWMVHTARMPVVRHGIALQAAAVVAAIGVFISFTVSAFFIDVFESSKVASLFWGIIGLAFSVNNKNV